MKRIKKIILKGNHPNFDRFINEVLEILLQVVVIAILMLISFGICYLCCK